MAAFTSRAGSRNYFGPSWIRTRVAVCLYTRSPTRAQKLAAALPVQLEMVWTQIAANASCPGSRPSPQTAAPAASMSKPGDLYRRLKGGGNGKGFNAYPTAISDMSWIASSPLPGAIRSKQTLASFATF